jgi:hypothetical protein
MQPLWKPLTEQLPCPTGLMINHILMFFASHQSSGTLILMFTTSYQTHLMGIS